MSFIDLTIEEYTARSVVVQGDTRKYKEDLKKLGGKYNSRLKTGPGWIFSKSSEDDLRSFIKKGRRLVSEKTGDRNSRNYPTTTRTFGSHVNPTLTEYGAMMILVKKMVTKIDLLEKAVLILLDDEQKEELKKSDSLVPSLVPSEDNPSPMKRLMR
jgi:hypothetical protein